MTLDCTGQRCPQPVIELARAAKGAAEGTLIVVLTDDPAAIVDIPAWCRMRGHACEAEEPVGGVATHRVIVKRSSTR